MSTTIFDIAAQTPVVQGLLHAVEKGEISSYEGISRGAQPFFSVVLRRFFPHRPILVVTDGPKTQELFQQDIETWLRIDPMADGEWRVTSGAEPIAAVSHRSPAASRPSPAPCPTTDQEQPATHRVDATNTALRTPPPALTLFYPAWENLPHEGKLPHADVISERLETLVALATGPAPGGAPATLVVTTVAALMQRTFSPSLLRSRMRELQRGCRLDPLELTEWLEAQGYEPEAKVTQKGELALRGGILDVYPLSSPWPVRLEFFGDELESLRYFDPLTQLSKSQIDTVLLPPAGELGLLRKWLAAHADRNGAGQPPEAMPGDALATLLDYLPAHAIIICCEPELLAEQARNYARQVPPADPFLVGWEDWITQIRSRAMIQIDLREATALTVDPGNPPLSIDLGFSGLETFRPVSAHPLEPQLAETQRRDFFLQLHRWTRQGYTVLVSFNNEGERRRFEEIWLEFGLAQETGSAGLLQAIGSLTCGFVSDRAKLVVVTDAEIFGRYKIARPRRLKSPHALAMRSALDIDFSDLEEGDYVVHLQYGIGKYLGLKVLPATAGRPTARTPEAVPPDGQECLVIEYAPRDPDQPPPKLYVPLREAHLVSKYVGAGKARPPLHTLGGARWAKAKVQAEEAVRDLAGELLSIQAARTSQTGHAVGSDTPWQREFEAAFIYEETPDQRRAILETKADQEAPRPMDRLICGDVGFGKTEVALRAAFKTVMDGRQVAVLVPTTVLAQQHFNTFRERMADYPIRLELLSRFRSRSEQLRVVRDLANGSVDLVIGTHRLIQDDIVFKDLGLVVIDEEQRFGVIQKEKFKLLRQLVDVLTLSATPIPRTLYLALTGARDMSTIETPPQDRLPVETIVIPFDERVIRDAIQRELNRQGQVFFLHNRIDTIETMALRLRTLVPDSRIVVGHGQMESDHLEEVMAQFVNGDADVLLSTTIIESGLDIPNANTIIIDRADRFGLSDLYQLRGRVGRYKHQAYAYLLLPRHAGLLADARKRLGAIKQYSSLGSGFKIAMRDLEIRGAGNLLGPEQSGHISAVGFDLYCQLLKQSISALKGEPVKPRIAVNLRLDFLALNPGEETLGFEDAGSRIEDGNHAPEMANGIDKSEINNPKSIIPRTPAYIPFGYIADPRQRIEVYRRLAQTTHASALNTLRTELRDRFGPLPPAVDLLILVTELKILAGAKAITEIETKGDKLILVRHGDYLTFNGKFPRLSKKEPKSRLTEIKQLLQSL